MACQGCEERRRLLDEALRARLAGDHETAREHLRALAQSTMDDLKKLALAKLRPASEDE